MTASLMATKSIKRCGGVWKVLFNKLHASGGDSCYLNVSGGLLSVSDGTTHEPMNIHQQTSLSVRCEEISKPINVQKINKINKKLHLGDVLNLKAL